MELYFSDLTKEAQTRLLVEFGLSSEQEANWDVFPITIIGYINENIESNYYISFIYNDKPYVSYYKTKEELMNEASRAVCFKDCDDELQEIIIHCGDEGFVQYDGWRPDMEIVFIDVDNNIVWDKFYPQFEH